MVDLKQIIQDKKIGWITVILGILLITLGVWAPGLWDPWEMNRARVARRMFEKPNILVVGSQDFCKKVNDKLHSIAHVDQRVVKSSPLGSAEAALSNNLYLAVIIDNTLIDKTIKGDARLHPAREAALNLVDTIPDNLTTYFVFVGKDAKARLLQIINEAGQLSAKASDNQKNVRMITQNCISVPSVDQVTEVMGMLHTKVAQFKKKNETRLMAPLEPYVTGLGFEVFGLNEFGARFNSILWGILILILTYLYTRRSLRINTCPSI